MDRQSRYRHWTHAGDNHPQSVLTEDQVREIKSRRAEGELLRVLAAEYGVSLSLVGNICTGRAWKHVT